MRGELSLTYTSGGASSARQELSIPEDSQLLRLMELQGGAQDFPFPPKTRLPQGEKDWLASFHGRTPLELLHSMEREGFRLPGDAPELKRLAEALRRALAADPARRYATAEEMRSELIALLRACPTAPAAPALDADTVMLPDGVRRL